MSEVRCSSVFWRAERAALLEEMQTLVHGLSQPLTSVSLALTLATAPIMEEEREQVLETAQQQCTRAMRQIDALRNCLAGKLEPNTRHRQERADA